MYGLNREAIRAIQSVLARYPQISKAILYGSRAKGNDRKHSDIDMTLIGTDLSLSNSVYPLMDALDDLLLPYDFDLSIFAHIDNPALIEHINRVGKVLYSQQESVVMGWSNETLGDYCKVIAGQSPEGRYYNTIGEGLPFHQGKKEFGDRYIGAPQKWTTKITKEAKSGDILMSVRAPVGPINFSTQKICIGRGLAAIRPIDTLDKDFLFYYLLSKQDEIKGNEGAVFASINKSQIENLRFSYVNLEEQKRIVSILDQAFADIDKARAHAEQNLKNTRELFESYLQQVFSQRGEGWVEKPIKDVVDSVLTGPFGSMLHKSDYVTGGIPLVNPINLIKGEIIPNDSKTVTHGTAETLKGYILSVGDLIIGRRGEIGRCAVVTTEQDGWICGTGCFYIKPSDELNSYFLANLLRSPNCRDALERLSKGATMKNLSNSSLKNFVVSFPSKVDEQEAILVDIDGMRIKTQSIESIYTKKLIALNKLKKSILQKAFTGELTRTIDQGVAA